MVLLIKHVLFTLMVIVGISLIGNVMAAQPTDTEETPPRTTPTVQHGISPNLVIQIRAGIDENNCKDTEQGCFDFVPENATVNLGEKVMIINKNDRLHDLRNCPYTVNGINVIWCEISDIFGTGHLPPGHSSTWTANKAGNITLYDAYTNVQGTYTVIDPNANDDTDETNDDNDENNNDRDDDNLACKAEIDKNKKLKKIKNDWRSKFRSLITNIGEALDTESTNKTELIQMIRDYRVSANQAQICTDDENQWEVTFNTLQTKYNDLETKYNQTISELRDAKFEINKLKQEKSNLIKKIEELESDTLDDGGSEEQYQGQSHETTPSNVDITPVVQTPIQISIPDSMEFDNNGRTIDLYTFADNKIRIDTYYPRIGTEYYINDKASITLFRDTEITNQQFKHTNQDPYCYVGDLQVGQNSRISTSHANSLQISFRESTDDVRCDDAPSITFGNSLNLNQQIYVKFTATDEQVPFYYTTAIIDVPMCNNTNFNKDTNTLTSGDTCYGKNGNDIIIVSNILTIFGIK